MEKVGEEKEKEIERKVWSECRINKECLHSYCKECIEFTATTSQICPICHVPLPSPLSSLPINHTLLHWQTLSPKQMYKINLSVDVISERNYCQQCEKSEVEINCDECNFQYCSSCSQQIHSLKQFVNHKLRIVNELSQNVTTKTPINSNFIEFYKCSLHSNEEMKLYCKDCQKFVCVYCIDQSHSDHKLITAMRFVDETKEKWKNNIVSSKSINQSLNSFLSQLSSTSTEKSLKESIKKLDDEIEELEDKLKNLKVKREEAHEKLDVLMESKEKIILSTRFLNNSIDKLPPLPLSSFLPSPSPIIILKNIFINRGDKRIKDFFEENNLSKFFLGLITPYTENPNYHYPLNKYPKDYVKEMNQLIITNQLTPQNLIRSFTLPKIHYLLNHKKVSYLVMNSKLNIIAMSSSSEVNLFNLQGNYQGSMSLTLSSKVIAIIPSIHFIAYANSTCNNLNFFDFTNSNKENYTIKLKSLDKPIGVSFCTESGILAFYNREEVFFYQFNEKDSTWKYHSKFPFSYKKNNITEICISPHYLIVGDVTCYRLFSIITKKNNELSFHRITIFQRSELGLKSVAIHPRGNYWVTYSDTSLYFITFTGVIISIFTPTKQDGTTLFNCIEGVAVDGDDDLISICDFSREHRIFIIRSPMFNGNLHYKAKPKIMKKAQPKASVLKTTTE